MATTAKTVKAKTRVKAAVKKRRKATHSDVISTRKIHGISGKGVLQLGNKTTLELRDRLAMPRQMFCRVVNVSERTIAETETGKVAAEKLKRPYNEVYRLYEALSEVADRESLGLWFQTPNDAFDGLKPVEVIERGEIDRLWNMVFQLRTGMPA